MVTIRVLVQRRAGASGVRTPIHALLAAEPKIGDTIAINLDGDSTTATVSGRWSPGAARAPGPNIPTFEADEL
jgi:hypothetical protein